MRYLPTNRQIVLAYVGSDLQTQQQIEARAIGLVSQRGVAGTLERLRQLGRIERVVVGGVPHFRRVESPPARRNP